MAIISLSGRRFNIFLIRYSSISLFLVNLNFLFFQPYIENLLILYFQIKTILAYIIYFIFFQNKSKKLSSKYYYYYYYYIFEIVITIFFLYILKVNLLYICLFGLAHLFLIISKIDKWAFRNTINIIHIIFLNAIYYGNIFIEIYMIIFLYINARNIYYYLKTKNTSFVNILKPQESYSVYFLFLAIIVFLNNGNYVFIELAIMNYIVALFIDRFLFMNIDEFFSPIHTKSYYQENVRNIIFNLPFIYVCLFYLILLTNNDFSYKGFPFLFIVFILLLSYELLNYFIKVGTFDRVEIDLIFNDQNDLKIKANSKYNIKLLSPDHIYSNEKKLKRLKIHDLYYVNPLKICVIESEYNSDLKNLFLFPYTNSIYINKTISDWNLSKSPDNYSHLSQIYECDEVLRFYSLNKLNKLIANRLELDKDFTYDKVFPDVVYLHKRITYTDNIQLRLIANVNFIEISCRYYLFIKGAVLGLDFGELETISYGLIVSKLYNEKSFDTQNYFVNIGKDDLNVFKQALRDINYKGKLKSSPSIGDLLLISTFIRNKLIGHGSIYTTTVDLLIFIELISFNLLKFLSEKLDGFKLHDKENAKEHRGFNCSTCNSYNGIVLHNGIEYNSENLIFHEGYLYVLDGCRNNIKEFINYTNGKRVKPDLIEILPVN